MRLDKYKCLHCGAHFEVPYHKTSKRCPSCFIYCPDVILRGSTLYTHIGELNTTDDFIEDELASKYNWKDGAKEDTSLKHSKAKLRYDLLPIEAVEEIIKVLMGGIAKGYAEDSWKDVDREDYISAIYRHLGEIKKGNNIDNDFGLHHSAHLATDAIFLLYKDLVNK